jgi:hypothetical protein
MKPVLPQDERRSFDKGFTAWGYDFRRKQHPMEKSLVHRISAGGEPR